MLFLDLIKTKNKTHSNQTSRTKRPGPAKNGQEKGPIWPSLVKNCQGKGPGQPDSVKAYREDLEKQEECGVVAHERLTEPSVTIK